MWVVFAMAGLLGWLVYCRGSRELRMQGQIKSFTGLSKIFMSADVADSGLLCSVSGKLVDFLRNQGICQRLIEDVSKDTSQLISGASQNMLQMPSGPADFLLLNHFRTLRTSWAVTIVTHDIIHLCPVCVQV